MKLLSRNPLSRGQKKAPQQPADKGPHRPHRFIPSLELLESRTLLSATLLDSLINPTPGQESALNDASVSQVFNPNGTPLGPNDPIVAGDIIVGVLRINNGITHPAPTFTNTQQLAILFSAQIQNQTMATVGPNDFYLDTLGLTPQSSGLTIDQLLSGPGSQFATGTFSPDTVVAMLEDGNNPNNPTTNATLAQDLTAFQTTYTLDQSMGIVNTGPGGTNADGSMDIFNARIQVPTGTPLTAAGIANLGSTSAIGQDVGTFSTILNPAGLANYMPVSETDSLVTGKTFQSDCGFSAQLVVPVDLQIANGWQIGDHSIIKVNAVTHVPQISTTQQPASATVGTSIADQATVTGLVNPQSGDTVTFEENSRSRIPHPGHSMSPAVLTFGGMASPARAGFKDTLTPGLNSYEDISREEIFFTNPGAGLSVGDVFVGFSQIQTKTGGPRTFDTIYAVFSQTITAINGNNISFAATPAGNPESLQSILPGSGITPGVLAAVFDRPLGNNFPLDLVNQAPAGATNINGYLQNIAANGTYEVGFGLTAANDFFSGQSVLPPAGVNPGVLGATPNSVTIAGFFGGLGLIDNNTGLPLGRTVLVLNPLDGTLSNHDLGVVSGSVRGASNDANYNIFSGGIGSLNTGGVGDNASFVVQLEAVPNTPNINTTQQPASATVGSSIADTATVTGLVDAQSGDTVTFNLYSSATVQNSTTLLFTDTETVSLSGSTATATSKGFTTTATGTDFWVATFNGDNNNSPVTSGAAAEPVTITPNTPQISTTQLPASATVGTSIADKATVTGLVSPKSGDTVTFNLYSSATVQNSSTLLFSDNETVTLNGSTATATSKGYTATATGTDYWVATFNGDSNNHVVTSGAAAEPVTITPNITPNTPNINTTQQPASATVGASIADQATVNGFHPTGTVTFALYNNASASGTPLFTDTENLVNGVATSKGYTATATGTDYWVATYNGDRNNSSVTSSPTAEPVTILPTSPPPPPAPPPPTINGMLTADQVSKRLFLSSSDPPSNPAMLAAEEALFNAVVQQWVNLWDALLSAAESLLAAGNDAGPGNGAVSVFSTKFL